MAGQKFSRTSYLALLSARLRRGLANLDGAHRARHARAILSFQKEDGGFAGRRGAADLYYTGFAVRALDALGKLDENLSQGIRAFLRSKRPENIIDQLSAFNGFLLTGEDGAATEETFEFLEDFRGGDGGYAKVRGAGSGSTYHTFLAVLCYDLFGKRPPDPDGVREFVKGQNRDDGGFCDSPSARHSNTNATAAGLSVAILLAQCESGLIERATTYLLGMRHGAGGWLASKNAPVPDLLSTHTALLTLESMGASGIETLVEALCFARSCERSEGGFMAGPWDDKIDVEYTYYGLGILALALEKGVEAGRIQCDKRRTAIEEDRRRSSASR